jgi:hypothetical protein
MLRKPSESTNLVANMKYEVISITKRANIPNSSIRKEQLPLAQQSTLDSGEVNWQSHA